MDGYIDLLWIIHFYAPSGMCMDAKSMAGIYTSGGIFGLIYAMFSFLLFDLFCFMSGSIGGSFVCYHINI